MCVQFTAMALLIVITFAGFSLPRESVPDWWIWAYYLSPLSWALQSLVINEMTQDRWHVPVAGSDQTMGASSFKLPVLLLNTLGTTDHGQRETKAVSSVLL